MVFKEVILKNGQTCKFCTPSLKNAKQIAEYSNKVAGETRFLLSSPQDEAKTEELEIAWINSAKNSNKKLIVMATIKNQIVGLGDFSAVSSKFRTRHRCALGISVAKEFWRQGIASNILQILIDKAAEFGYEQMELQVDAKNKAGIHLYQKFGFIKTGKIKNYSKYEDNTYSDEYLMQRDL